MSLLGFIVGSLLVAAMLGPAAAEEALPPGVINVTLPEFGERVVGGDYGLANLEPVEVGQSVGQGEVVRIVRTPHDLQLSRRRTARFQVLLGEVQDICFWIESPPLRGTWKLSITAIHLSGYREAIFGEDFLREVLYCSRVPPRARLEFFVTTNITKGQQPQLSKPFRITVSPIFLSLWSDLRPVPSPYGWGVILP